MRFLDYRGAPEFGRPDGIKPALTFVHNSGVYAPVIVECGTTRGTYGGGIVGDGWATLAFGWYARTYGGRVHTIDLSQRAVNESRRICGVYAPVIEWHIGAAAAVIRDLAMPIDLLYLDAADNAQQALAQLAAAYEHLRRPFAVVLVDDAEIKGPLVKTFLLNAGWSCRPAPPQLLFYRAHNCQPNRRAT